MGSNSNIKICLFLENEIEIIQSNGFELLIGYVP